MVRFSHTLVICAVTLSLGYACAPVNTPTEGAPSPETQTLAPQVQVSASPATSSRASETTSTSEASVEESTNSDANASVESQNTTTTNTSTAQAIQIDLSNVPDKVALADGTLTLNPQLLYDNNEKRDNVDFFLEETDVVSREGDTLVLNKTGRVTVHFFATGSNNIRETLTLHVVKDLENAGDTSIFNNTQSKPALVRGGEATPTPSATPSNGTSPTPTPTPTATANSTAMQLTSETTVLETDEDMPFQASNLPQDASLTLQIEFPESRFFADNYTSSVTLNPDAEGKASVSLPFDNFKVTVVTENAPGGEQIIIPGTYKAQIINNDTDEKSEVFSFEITEEGTPTLTIDSSESAGNGVIAVNIKGTGFSAGEPVEIVWRVPQGAIVTDNFIADTDGEISFTAGVDTVSSPGTHCFSGRDVETGTTSAEICRTF